MIESKLPIPEFMVRVKLPDASGFSSCPSGDSEYEEAYKKAIFAAKPDGYEVSWPRLNEKWPVDSEGFTYVRLYIHDTKAAFSGLAFWMERTKIVENKLNQIKKILGVD